MNRTGSGRKKKIAFQIKSRVRPMEFLLDANLPEPLQKFHRIHAQVSHGKIWEACSLVTIYYRKPKKMKLHI